MFGNGRFVGTNDGGNALGFWGYFDICSFLVGCNSGNWWIGGLVK